MRDEILKYLGTVMQSSANTLATKLCTDRLSVARELHAMAQDGIVEREMKKGEYLYWLTRKDGVEMHPTTLPAGVTTAPKTASAVTAKPEVTEKELGSVEEALNLALQLQAMTRERDELLQKCSVAPSDAPAMAHLRKELGELEDKASVLQLNFDREVAAHNATRKERDDLVTEIADLQRECGELMTQCANLQVQIDQYDERQRFESWFTARPENTGQPSLVKEKMWESWLERSKLTEVAA